MTNNLTELKMDQELRDALEKAASHKMSAEERMNQRVSFVYGSLSSDNNMTKEQIKEIISEAS